HAIPEGSRLGISTVRLQSSVEAPDLVDRPSGPDASSQQVEGLAACRAGPLQLALLQAGGGERCLAEDPAACAAVAGVDRLEGVALGQLLLVQIPEALAHLPGEEGPVQEASPVHLGVRPCLLERVFGSRKI